MKDSFISNIEQEGYILNLSLNLIKPTNFEKIKKIINNFISLRDVYICNIIIDTYNSSKFIKLLLKLKFILSEDVCIFIDIQTNELDKLLINNNVYHLRYYIHNNNSK